jgi:hypothetical protein
MIRRYPSNPQTCNTAISKKRKNNCAHRKFTTLIFRSRRICFHLAPPKSGRRLTTRESTQARHLAFPISHQHSLWSRHGGPSFVSNRAVSASLPPPNRFSLHFDTCAVSTRLP